jgi:hypothetical protein
MPLGIGNGIGSLLLENQSLAIVLSCGVIFNKIPSENGIARVFLFR